MLMATKATGKRVTVKVGAVVLVLVLVVLGGVVVLLLLGQT